MIDGIAASRWLIDRGSVDPGMCLYYVWQAYKAQGASTGRSAPTATIGWEQSDGKRRGDRNPPAGAAVWWGRRYDGNNDGDVVISLGGGRVVATDYPGWRQTGATTLDAREAQIGREYLGWTSSIFDCPINVAAGKDAAPIIPTIPESFFQEDIMSPIVNVVPRYGLDPNVGTIYIGRDDGTFDPLDGPPYPVNVRGVIGVAFLGSKDGSKDVIPTLSAGDFEAVKKVWAQMRRGRIDPKA